LGLAKDIVRFSSVISCSLIACSEEEPFEFVKAEQISKSIYVERYYRKGGIDKGGGIKRYFATDPSSFRIKIGHCDDKQFLNVVANGCNLIVKKYSRRNIKNGKPELIEEKKIKIPDCEKG